MEILVPVKRVVDYNVKVGIKSDGIGVEIANVVRSINPFAENAAESGSVAQRGSGVHEKDNSTAKRPRSKPRALFAKSGKKRQNCRQFCSRGQ